MDGYLEAYLYNWVSKQWVYFGKNKLTSQIDKMKIDIPEAREYVSEYGHVYIRFAQRTKWWKSFSLIGDRVQFKLTTRASE